MSQFREMMDTMRSKQSERQAELQRLIESNYRRELDSLRQSQEQEKDKLLTSLKIVF